MAPQSMLCRFVEKADPFQGIALHVWSIKDAEFKVPLGILDSGIRHKWVCLDLVTRLGARAVNLAQAASFKDFQGVKDSSRPTHATMALQQAFHTREGRFLAAETAPFDILLGSDFLFSERVFTFNEAALVNFEDHVDECGLAFLTNSDFLAYMSRRERRGSCR